MHPFLAIHAVPPYILLPINTKKPPASVETLAVSYTHLTLPTTERV